MDTTTTTPPQRSASELARLDPDLGAERDPRAALIRTTAEHGPTCGERVPSPHAACQERYAPYLAGERTVRRWGEVVVLCVACGAAWREVAA